MGKRQPNRLRVKALKDIITVVGTLTKSHVTEIQYTTKQEKVKTQYVVNSQKKVIMVQDKGGNDRIIFFWPDSQQFMDKPGCGIMSLCF